MANNMDPLHLSARKKNAELQIVIGFLQDCLFDCAFPHKAILRVDALETFLPNRRSLRWIEAVNPVPFIGEVHRIPIRYAPNPAASVGQLLRLGQVRLPKLQLPGQQFLLGDIDRGAEEPLKDFAFNHGNSDAANVALLAVGANNSFFYIAARAFRMHSPDCLSHEVAVCWVHSGQILLKCWGSLLRIQAVNLEQLLRPVLKKTRGVKSPTSHMSEALPFTDIKLASQKRFLRALAVSYVLICAEQQVWTARGIPFHVSHTVDNPHLPSRTEDPSFY